MKWYQFFFIMSAIYIAPHTDKIVNLTIGLGLVILAFIAVYKGE